MLWLINDVYVDLGASIVQNNKNVSVGEGKKDIFVLQMSYWEYIGYIYQSRKYYRVNNILV